MINTLQRISDRLLGLMVPATPVTAVTCRYTVNRCYDCFQSPQNRSGRYRYKVKCCTNGDCYGTYGRCGSCGWN